MSFCNTRALSRLSRLSNTKLPSIYTCHLSTAITNNSLQTSWKPTGKLTLSSAVREHSTVSVNAVLIETHVVPIITNVSNLNNSSETMQSLKDDKLLETFYSCTDFKVIFVFFFSFVRLLFLLTAPAKYVHVSFLVSLVPTSCIMLLREEELMFWRHGSD